MTMAGTVVIIAAREEDALAQRIASDLRARGLAVATSRDVLDIPPGADWASRYHEFLDSAAAYVLLLSPAAIDTPAIASEVYAAAELATSHEPKRPLVPVVAAFVPRWSLPAYVAARLRLDLTTTPYADVVEELAAALDVPAPGAPVALDVPAPGEALPKPAPFPGGEPSVWVSRGASAPPSPAPAAPASAPAPAAQPAPAAPPMPATAEVGAVAPADEAAGETNAEQVTFTAYHPKEVTPRVWQPLLVYVSVDTPAAHGRVAALAQERLLSRREQFRPASAPEPAWLRRGAPLTLVPDLPGFRFNPPQLRVTWEEEVQQHEFRLRAETARPGQAANGRLRVYTGPLLRAEVPLSIFVQQADTQPTTPEDFASVLARAYRRVFASYSHRDTPVVRSCEAAAESTGDRYLRDVTLLRSGEDWDSRLLQAIVEADVFQLFWSEHAATSPAVTKEWQYALSLQPARGAFIRPVYWSRQPYTIPPELEAIHFERLDLSRLGWGPLRTLLAGLLGG
jgi:hypothetical protein